MVLFLPGYLETPGFFGSSNPSWGYIFGSQKDIRYLAARNGWLTVFQNSINSILVQQIKI